MQLRPHIFGISMVIGQCVEKWEEDHVGYPSCWKDQNVTSCQLMHGICNWRMTIQRLIQQKKTIQRLSLALSRVKNFI